MDIILLERIGRLGSVGDVVTVKNGYARNYLIPQKKALRANKANKEVFEAQRDVLEKQNDERKAAAVAQAEAFGDLIVTVVRQASDDGKLYGSVAVRDVADALKAEGHVVDRTGHASSIIVYEGDVNRGVPVEGQPGAGEWKVGPQLW